MPLSNELQVMLEQKVSDKMLAQWVRRHAVAIRDALEMDELTGSGRIVAIPEINLADMPAFVAQMEARRRGG
ncbi:hypothetical protein [Novosphingobium rosa]|uniref:hypothetical protein n=1 Tax=Novosphingobium rosa TaxID=76978 RepID=UPI0008367414|nr:hypothetical protein [Novosphingobium rosa]